MPVKSLSILNGIITKKKYCQRLGQVHRQLAEREKRERARALQQQPERAGCGCRRLHANCNSLIDNVYSSARDHMGAVMFFGNMRN